MREFLRRPLLALADVAQAAALAPARALGLPRFPVPPFSAMRRTTSRWLFHYYHSGLTTYLPIATAALAQDVGLGQRVKVLDFGAGAARQLLHFTRHFPAPEYHACEVDPALVEFLRRAYPGVAVRRCRPDPPLDYPAGQFDLIYSVSVFSHLHPDDHVPWLAELCRVLRPGGACLVTTEGWTALPRVARTIGDAGVTLAAELAQHGRVFRPYLRAPVAELGARYGSAVLTPEHIRREWAASGMEVAGVLEGIINRRQDLTILRRP